MKTIKLVFMVLMAGFYVLGGVNHFRDPAF